MDGDTSLKIFATAGASVDVYRINPITHAQLEFLGSLNLPPLTRNGLVTLNHPLELGGWIGAFDTSTPTLLEVQPVLVTAVVPAMGGLAWMVLALSIVGIGSITLVLNHRRMI